MSIDLSPDADRIFITNDGSVEANEITLLADGKPIEEHGVWVGNQDYPTKLRPEEEMSVRIALSMGSPRRADIRVEWLDPDGKPHSREKLLQFL